MTPNDTEQDFATFAKFVEKNAHQPVRYAMFGVLVDAWMAMNAKNIIRNARLDALEQRVAALEARPSVQDKGVWRSGQCYQPGDIVSRSGSAWICRGSHMAVGDDLSHEHFRLLVKRGRDARS